MNHGKVPHTCKPNGGWKRAGRPGKVQHALMCASTVLIFQQTVNCWLGNHHIIWASWFRLPLPSTVMSGRIKTSGTFFKGNQFRKAHWKYIKCLITLHLLGSDKMTEEQILNKTYFGVSQTPLFTHGPLFEAGVQKHRRFVKAKCSSGCLRPTEQLTQQFYNLKKVTDLIGERPDRGVWSEAGANSAIYWRISVLWLQPWFCHHPQICGRNHIIEHHWSAVQMHSNCVHTAESPRIYSFNEKGAVARLSIQLLKTKQSWKCQ